MPIYRPDGYKGQDLTVINHLLSTGQMTQAEYDRQTASWTDNTGAPPPAPPAPPPAMLPLGGLAESVESTGMRAESRAALRGLMGRSGGGEQSPELQGLLERSAGRPRGGQARYGRQLQQTSLANQQTDSLDRLRAALGRPPRTPPYLY